MVDCEDLLPIHSDLHVCLVLLRKPESIDLLIVAHEVDPLNPEGEFLSGMPDDPNDGVVSRINPHFAFEQIFVRALWRRSRKDTTIRSDLLLA